LEFFLPKNKENTALECLYGIRFTLLSSDLHQQLLIAKEAYVHAHEKGRAKEEE
jgi:hypothetical protein